MKTSGFTTTLGESWVVRGLRIRLQVGAISQLQRSETKEFATVHTSLSPAWDSFELRNYLLSLFLLSHIEVTKLITVLLVCDDAKEVAELLLLEVLLSQVLKVALRHRDR